MNTPQTRFITLSAMKVTNTDHMLQMVITRNVGWPHFLALFAPLREFFLADVYCVVYFSQLFIAWYISRQAAKVAKIICNTK